MIINSTYTLTYCSNIFKVNNINKLIDNINKYIESITDKKRNIGISLCISNQILKKLRNQNTISKIKTWQINNKIYIPSINGFVYQKFHKKHIKEKIYSPDWTSINRFYFTKNLILLSNSLRVHKKTINISTLPLSYKNWSKKTDIDHILYSSVKNITMLINTEIQLNIKNRYYTTIDIEPEPTCTIEDYKTLINFNQYWLNPAQLKNHNSITKLKKHIGVCYDICHLSTMFCKHEKTINILKRKKININKIQISSSLKTIIPKNKKHLSKIKKNLILLNKSNFLHQSNFKKQKNLEKYTDINKMLNIVETKKNYELRIHCHIPIYKKKFKCIDTTYTDIEKITKLLKHNHISKNLEIETYTKSLFFNKINYKKSIKKEYYITIKNMQT